MNIVEWKEWADLDFATPQEQEIAEEAVVADLIKSGRIITGFRHQGSPDGCPWVNGIPLALSYRSWGHLMATARNRAENTTKYTYTDFAWD